MLFVGHRRPLKTWMDSKTDDKNYIANTPKLKYVPTSLFLKKGGQR